MKFTKLSRLAQREIQYLQQGGSSICDLAVRELVRKGLVVRDRQSFSNSPYTGTEVSLTKQGKFWPEEPPAMTMLSDLSQDQRSHLAWRLDHKTCCGLGTAAAVARGDHGDKDLVTIFMEYGCRTKKSAQTHARFVEQFKVDPDKRAVLDLSLEITSLVSSMVKARNLSGKQTAMLYRQLIKSHETFVRNLESIDWDKVASHDNPN